MVVDLLSSFPPLLQLLSKTESMSCVMGRTSAYFQLSSFLPPRVRAEGERSWSAFPFSHLALAFSSIWSLREAGWSLFGLGDACVKSVSSRRSKGTSSEVWGRCSYQRSPPKACSTATARVMQVVSPLILGEQQQFCNVLQQPQLDNTGRCFRRTREDRASSVPGLWRGLYIVDIPLNILHGFLIFGCSEAAIINVRNAWTAFLFSQVALSLPRHPDPAASSLLPWVFASSHSCCWQTVPPPLPVTPRWSLQLLAGADGLGRCLALPAFSSCWAAAKSGLVYNHVLSLWGT